MTETDDIQADNILELSTQTRIIGRALVCMLLCALDGDQTDYRQADALSIIRTPGV